MTEHLQALLDGLLRKRGVRHAVLAVESGDGRVRWVGAAGEADDSGRQMTPATPYLIASVTKLYIAAVVLRLAERGLIGLDVPFAEYLPAAIADRLHVLDGVDRTRRITVRHLLAHASGLPDHLEDRPKGGRPLIDRVLTEGDREVRLEEVASIVREELRPYFPPQDLQQTGRVRIRYSDTNYQLLIGIVEAVLARPWREAVRAELLEPLGLRHTWAPGGRPLDATEEPATLWAGTAIVRVPRLLASMGDLYSTAADQIRFLRALMTAEVFADPATLDEMGARWNRFGFDPTTPRLPGWPIEYGAGMMRFALPRWLMPLARVPPVVGHTGSTGTWLFYCPELDVYTCGGVDQVTAAAVPFRTVPQLLGVLARSGHLAGSP